MPPLVSVLLPYRNAAPTLAEALASVLDEREVPLEVVAADDGSSDEGPAIVGRLAAADPRLVPIATGGVGIARALAAAASVARAPFLARMDGDDVSLPGRFAAELDALERDPRLGAVGTRVEAFPDAAVGEGLRLYVAWQNELVTPDDHARELFVESPLCHPSVMMRREAYDRAGGFVPTTWAEDYDLWLRLDREGYGLAKVPRVLLRWRHQEGRATFRDALYALDRFRFAKACYLAPKLLARGRPVAVWGAGKTGRRFARALAERGAPASLFVDIDPRKIGRTAQGSLIVPPSALPRGAHTVVVAVGARGARTTIREQLQERDFLEGHDYLFAA
jgi:glycosyltransferase involved in cell wall biosynthesis